MNSIIYIKTSDEIDSYSQELIAFLGEAHGTEEIFNQTSLSVSPNFLKMYFYGNTNQTINFLFAKDSSNNLRIFIEGVNKKDNLDQLVTGIKHVFQNVTSFFNSKKIKFSDISATIWSEDEEMLKGEYQDYDKKFKSSIPDIPTGIYLSVLMIIYSIVQPKVDGSETTLLNSFISALINLLIAFLAILLWLHVKATYKSSDLSFKIK